MERFVLERKIPVDIWRELKTYLVHNIQTQAKHMKKEKSIINFNDTLRQVPRIKPPPSGPRIIYNTIYTSNTQYNTKDTQNRKITSQAT